MSYLISTSYPTYSASSSNTVVMYYNQWAKIGTDYNADGNNIRNIGMLTNEDNTQVIDLKDASGDIEIKNASLNLLTSLKLTETKDSTDYIELKAGANITASYPIILPNSQGLNGDILINDGAGSLSWSSSLDLGGSLSTDEINPHTLSGTIDIKADIQANGLFSDYILEKTLNNGVVVDSFLFNDSKIYGGSSIGSDMTLTSTSDATKGKILFGTSAYDEKNNRLGIATQTPSHILEVVGTSDFSGAMKVDTINEHTAATGITLDGVLCKDNMIKASAFYTSSIYEDTGVIDFSATEYIKVFEMVDYRAFCTRLFVEVNKSPDDDATQRYTLLIDWIHRDSDAGFLKCYCVQQSAYPLTAIATGEGNGVNRYCIYLKMKPTTTLSFSVNAMVWNDITTAQSIRCISSLSAVNYATVSALTGYTETVIAEIPTISFTHRITSTVLDVYDKTDVYQCKRLICGDGAGNIYMGVSAKPTMGTNSGNISIGKDALDALTSSNALNNIAIGTDSGTSITTGDGNISIGYQSGDTITTGTYNNILGYGCDVAADSTNSIVIGKSLTGASNTILIGDTAITSAKFGYMKFDISGLSAERILTVQNSAGTIAYLSDLSARYYGGIYSGTTEEVAYEGDGSVLYAINSTGNEFKGSGVALTNGYKMTISNNGIYKIDFCASEKSDTSGHSFSLCVVMIGTGPIISLVIDSPVSDIYACVSGSAIVEVAASTEFCIYTSCPTWTTGVVTGTILAPTLIANKMN